MSTPHSHDFPGGRINGCVCDSPPVVRVEDFGPVQRAYAEAMHEDCEEEPKGHPLAAHSPWSGSDLDGVEPWPAFVARLARHGLRLILSTPVQDTTLRDKRLAAGLTQREAAFQAGVRLTYWSDVEIGRVLPSPAEYQRMREVLETKS